MSANNQILIAEYKDRWYVWDNIMAESWENENELSIKHALKSFTTNEEATQFAYETYYATEYPDECEYGVFEEELAKDGAKVKIID